MISHVIPVMIVLMCWVLPTACPAITETTENLATAGAVLSIPLSVVNANRLIASEPSATTGVLGSAIGLLTASLGLKIVREADGNSEGIGGGVVLTFGVAGLILGVLNIVGDVRDEDHREHDSMLIRYFVTPEAQGFRVHADLGF